MAYKTSPVPSKEELSNLYQQQGQSMAKLAEHYHVSSPTVKKWLINHGVEFKGYQQVRKEANAIIYKENKISGECLSLLSDYDWLYDQRITQHKSYATIGKEIGVSEPTVKKWVQKHNIPVSKFNESENKFKILLENKEYLEGEYAKNKTHQMIADEIGVHKSTVSVWFKKHGIVSK